jgi:hypothetical protein
MLGQHDIIQRKSSQQRNEKEKMKEKETFQLIPSYPRWKKRRFPS